MDQPIGLLDSEDRNAAANRALLSLGLGLLSSRGPFPQALGNAGMGAMGAYDQSLQRSQQDRGQDMQLRLHKAQLDDIAAQAALRQQQMKMELQKQEYFLGGGAPSSMPAAQQALGAGAQAGSVGPTIDNAARMPQMQPPTQGGRFGKVPDNIAAADYFMNGGKGIPQMMWDAQKPNMQVHNGVPVDLNRLQEGETIPVTSANGQTVQLIKDPRAPGGYRVITPQGATQAIAAQAIASKLPEMLINSGGKREDFTNPDGTTRSQTGLQFLQQSGGMDALTGVLGALNGQQPSQSAGAAASRPAGSVVPPQVQQGRDTERTRILQDELARETDPGNRAALQREIARTGVQSGVSSQSKIANDAAGKVNDAWLKTSYEPVVAADKPARDILASIKTSRFALSGLGDTGFGKETQVSVARVLAALGVPQAEKFATSGALFKQAATERLFAKLSEQNGVQTEGDAARAAKTFAAISIPKVANEYVLDLAEAKARWDQMRATYYQRALPLAQKEGDLQRVDREWQQVAPSVFDMPSMTRWKGKV